MVGTKAQHKDCIDQNKKCCDCENS